VEISRTLAHPPAIIVLSGPPGIGKTCLVLEAPIEMHGGSRAAWPMQRGHVLRIFAPLPPPRC